jgi:competence protein ComEA
MFFSKLKSFLRDYFTLTSRERKGALVLAVVIIIQILILTWLHQLPLPEAPLIVSHRMELDSFLAETMKRREAETVPVMTPAISSAALFAFDPNTISDSEWKKLGLSHKQTRVIRNYLNKGGRFKKKEDLAKMYGISAEKFQQLNPYISIKNETILKTNQLPVKEKKINPIELNTADTLMLASLPLIGPGRARMIVKYRDRLGGFVSTEQLLEVFTVDSTVLNAIAPYITLDIEKVKKINMNGDTLIHPYLPKKVASAIVSYRKQHGNFIDINELRKVSVLQEQMWLKVAPYSVFE